MSTVSTHGNMTQTQTVQETAKGKVTITVLTSPNLTQERVEREEGDFYFEIVQTSDISDAVMRSGHFATKEAAEAALSDKERALLGELVNIMFVQSVRVTTTTTNWTVA